MIGEPEMADEGGREAPLDTLSDSDRPPLFGRLRDRPWAWALGAVALTSAVWAATLQTTGYGRTAAPDLHGYRIGDSTCASINLQPLVDALSAHTFTLGAPPTITRSSALDHVDCQLAAESSTLSGWRTDFTVAVTVDLHKKTDPAAEFDAVSRTTVLSPPPGSGVAYLTVEDKGVTTHPADLGDRADLTSARSRQTLSVRHGGAVFSMTLTGTTRWDTSLGPMPVGANGTPKLPPATDTRKYTKEMVPAMRRLMTALSHPDGGS